jgi:serine protease AprX
MVEQHNQTTGRGIRWRSRGNPRSSAGSMARLVLIGTCSVTAVTMTALPASAGGGTPPLVDTGSLSSIEQITGVFSMWNQGYVGQGVGVAVIDTGVARVPGLATPGKVIDGPDLSFDSQDPNLAHIDAFGHGTHVAGIIAGSDVAPGTSGKGCKTCLGSSAYTDTTKFVGIAPEARIINVKVGAYDGAVDVSQVIAAIDWVVQHRNDPGLNIRVLNLSFGTDSLQPAQVDPLVHAAEVAWRAGIVVVAAGGNDGDKPGPLADPAYSPSIIAVGSTDPRGTISTRDDVVADFAQHGTDDRPVDVAAPGVSVRSLAVPGSFVDQNALTGKVGTRFQRASGTSQSTAVVSGLAALMISKYPAATPDAIKTYLQLVTSGMLESGDHHDDKYKGAGSANVEQVASIPTASALVWMKSIKSMIPTGTGLGSLEAARGSYHILIDGVPLTGEMDIFGQPFDAAAAAQASSAFTSWDGDLWSGARWSSGPWEAADWTGAQWSGARWTDAMWDGARWTSTGWEGARWSGARWSSGIWDGARWSGARWSGGRWSGGRWSNGGWS